MSRLNWKCHAAALLICALGVGPFAFKLLDRDIPYVRESGMILPDNPQPGAEISVVWKGRRERDCDGIVFRKIIDSHGVVHIVEGVPVRYFLEFDPAAMRRTFKLPVGVAPGPAKYIATTRFVCNFTQLWWPITVDVPPVYFNVASPLAAPPGAKGDPGDIGPRGPEGRQGAQGPQGESVPQR